MLYKFGGKKQTASEPAGVNVRAPLPPNLISVAFSGLYRSVLCNDHEFYKSSMELMLALHMRVESG